MTQLVSEAKILVMPLLWLHGRKKGKRGKARGDRWRDPETERGAGTDTIWQEAYDSSEENYLEIWREKESPTGEWPLPTSLGTQWLYSTLTLLVLSLCMIFTKPHWREEKKTGLSILNKVRDLLKNPLERKPKTQWDSTCFGKHLLITILISSSQGHFYHAYREELWLLEYLWYFVKPHTLYQGFSTLALLIFCAK